MHYGENHVLDVREHHTVLQRALQQNASIWSSPSRRGSAAMWASTIAGAAAVSYASQLSNKVLPHPLDRDDAARAEESRPSNLTERNQNVRPGW
jgi:hypothetical protein